MRRWTYCGRPMGTASASISATPANSGGLTARPPPRRDRRSLTRRLSDERSLPDQLSPNQMSTEDNKPPVSTEPGESPPYPATRLRRSLLVGRTQLRPPAPLRHLL